MGNIFAYWVFFSQRFSFPWLPDTFIFLSLRSLQFLLKFSDVTRSYSWNFLNFSCFFLTKFDQFFCGPPLPSSEKRLLQCLCLSTRRLDHNQRKVLKIFVKIGIFTDFEAIFLTLLTCDILEYGVSSGIARSKWKGGPLRRTYLDSEIQRRAVPDIPHQDTMSTGRRPARLWGQLHSWGRKRPRLPGGTSDKPARH